MKPWKRPRHKTSALSQLDFRVEGLEFTAGVADCYLPVDAALRGVDVRLPGGDFGLQGRQGAESASRNALPRQRAQLVLGNFQPTAMFGRVAEVEAAD